MEEKDNLYEEYTDEVIIEGEAVSGDETLEMVDELKEQGKISGSRLVFNLMTKIYIAIMILTLLYMNIMYIPHYRFMDNDNLFSKDGVSISEEEVNDICKVLESEFGIDLDEENDNSLLLNAIYCNDNLTDSEKDFCSQYIDLFNDNPYLDKERVYHSLLNLDISNKRRPYTYDKNVEGVYVDKYKSIGIFVDDKDNAVKAHELIHCICANDGSLPKFFSEGMTELLANEYFSSNPFLELKNYPFEIYAVKMLCDIAGSDAVLRSYTTGDMIYVYESLSSQYGTYDQAVKAVGILDKLFTFVNEDSDELGFSNDELTNDAFMYFNGVAENRYTDSTDFNSKCFYYNEIMLLNVIKSNYMDSLKEDLSEYGVFCKPYFSSKLKEEYSTPTVARFADATVITEETETKKLIK